MKRAPAKRTRGPGKKPRRDRKHDTAKLAALEDARRRRGERQKGAARELGVEPRRLRDALHQALHGDDPSGVLRILNGRLDEHADAGRVAHMRALAALAADPVLDRALWLRRFEELLQHHLDEELKARGLHGPVSRRVSAKKK